jgi:hypothetical protein
LGCGLAVEGVVLMGLARQGEINTTTCGCDDNLVSRDYHTSSGVPCLCIKYLQLNERERKRERENI